MKLYEASGDDPEKKHMNSLADFYGCLGEYK